MRFNWYRSVILLIGVGFVYLFISQGISMWTIHKEVLANQQRLAEVQQIHDQLLEEKAKLETPEYIEKVAREDLGLVRPGEVPYRAAKK